MSIDTPIRTESSNTDASGTAASRKLDPVTFEVKSFVPSVPQSPTDGLDHTR